MISEHGVTSEKLHQTHIPEYTIQAEFSRQHHLWGGVAIFTHSSMNTDICAINTTEFNTELLCELAAIEFKMGSRLFTLINAYRPTSGTVHDFIPLFDNFLNTISTLHRNIIILGDINIDTSRDSPDLKKLENTLQQHNLTIKKLPCTRITHSTSTSIDCCITNMSSITVRILNNTISDHHGVECTLDLHIKNDQALSLKCRNFTSKNFDLIKKALESENWETVYIANTPDKKYNELLKIITHHMNCFCPSVKKNIKQKSKQPFILTEELVRLRKITLDTRDRHTASGSLEDKLRYSEAKKNYDTKIKQAKREFINDKLDNASNQAKETWKIINQERNKNTKTDKVVHLKNNNTIETDPQKIANLFNNYFLKLGHSNATANAQDQDEEQNNIHFTDFNTNTLKNIKDVMTLVKPTRAAGADEVPGSLVHHCRKELLEPIADIINSSIVNSQVPQKMKTSLVYPKFKKQDKQDIGNYRPIAILPSLSKYLEKIIHNQLLTHLQTTNKIYMHQHGFRPNKSINTALSDLLQFVTDVWEKKENVSGIFLDLRKAFDCLNWDILLNKLWNIGIRGNAHKWMKNYLNDRHQYVELKSTIGNKQIISRSSLMPMTNGVPQGSILGPLLFLIYINGLPNKLPIFTKCLMFADDTTLLVSCTKKEDLPSRVTESITITENTLNDIKLTINHSKSIRLNFTTKSVIDDTCIETTTDTSIETFNSTKFLGITIDQHLSWKIHTENLTKKLSTSLYGLRRINSIAGEKAATIAYHSLFSSHLRFGIIAWGAAAQTHLEPILILQKKAVRVIGGLKQDDHCRPHFKRLKLLTLTSIYVYETIIHSTRTQKLTRSQIHSHDTRNKNALDLPFNRLTRAQNHPDYRGSKFYNCLPDHIKNIQTPKPFKKHLKDFLLDNPTYSTSEFLETCKAPRVPDD